MSVSNKLIDPCHQLSVGTTFCPLSILWRPSPWYLNLFLPSYSLVTALLYILQVSLLLILLIVIITLSCSSRQSLIISGPLKLCKDVYYVLLRCLLFTQQGYINHLINMTVINIHLIDQKTTLGIQICILYAPHVVQCILMIRVNREKVGPGSQ